MYCSNCYLRIAWLQPLRVQIATLQSLSSNYYTCNQNSKTSAFQSLWESQTIMTEDLCNVKSKSTNLNHTFSRFIESFSKNSPILFSPIQIDGRYLSFNQLVLISPSLWVFAQNFHKSCLLTSVRFQEETEGKRVQLN